ncbi:MAG: hypothetical protein Q8P15_02505 [Nanoarchaeota archaeon]|nr:hypothetical protein [Nanoarchaeota archaeon]
MRHISIPWHSELGENFVAIKLKENDELGARVLFHKIEEHIGISGGVILLQEGYLKTFDEYDVQYEKYFPKTNNVQEIYDHFNVKEETNTDKWKPSLIDRLFYYLCKR